MTVTRKLAPFTWLIFMAITVFLYMVWPIAGYVFFCGLIALAAVGIAVALIYRIGVGVEETIRYWGRNR